MGAAAGARSRRFDDRRHGRAERRSPRGGPDQDALTYITGSLVNFGETLADTLFGAERASAPWPYLALWLGMVFGGAAGAVAFATLGVRALTLPALAAALLAAVMAVLGWAASRRH
jgi:uncharacterized membrane protein YoaK (UPF0700 family)